MLIRKKNKANLVSSNFAVSEKNPSAQKKQKYRVHIFANEDKEI